MVTVFGLVFFGLAALVLVGSILYPSVIPSDFLPIAFVLAVMGAIGGFPEQYMRLFNPRLGTITNELQSHLSQIGVDSYIIDLKGAEAIRHRDKLWLPTGAVKIRNRNIDLVELKVRMIPEEGTAVQYVCAVRCEVRDENMLQAYTDGGGTWSGGRLADALNSDNELKTMLTRMNSLRITVRGIKSDSYAAIHKRGLGPASLDGMIPSYGLGDYPSADEFTVFDKIAGHVKEALPT
jgi:hypothetical protein